MFRDIDINEISDGKLYDIDDEVPVGCNACEGCSECCQTTGDSIILDPYDMYNLSKVLNKSFEEMIEKEIEIRMVDELILPNIKLYDENNKNAEDKCPFLNENKRCSIHKYRPGFCRLFPMGRYFFNSNDSSSNKKDYKYILQINECTKPKEERYNVKLSEWIGIEDIEQYEQFVDKWHSFKINIQEILSQMPEEKGIKMARYILQIFYVIAYDTSKDFYEQFYHRMSKISLK